MMNEWIVKDEDGRWHYQDCGCIEADGANYCRTRRFSPFATEAAARAHALALETARGVACTAYLVPRRATP
jgi:hypothetical protein